MPGSDPVMLRKQNDHVLWWRRVPGLWAYAAIIVMWAIMLISYYHYKNLAFAFWDIGSDTFLCFYPLQIAVATQLQQIHSITWSFSLGIGGFLGTLFDPLWLITSWLPPDWQLGLRLPMFIFRVLLAGGFFYGYLRQIGFAERLATLGGLAYALSAYGMINGQWEVIHGTEFVQLAAYLFLFEKFWRTSTPWAAVSAGLVVGLGNPFDLYQFALLSVLYCVLKMTNSQDGPLEDNVRLFLQFGLYAVAGILLAGPLILPATYYFLESPRVSGSHSVVHMVMHQIFSINDRATISSEIGTLVGKDLFGTGSIYKGWGNYFEGPSFYIGLLPLILLPQLLGPNATRRERWICVTALFAIVCYIVFPFFRYAAYGFGHGAFRLSSFWVAILILVLGLIGWRRLLISGIWKPGLIAGLALPVGIAATAIIQIPAITNAKYAFAVIAFSMVYAIVLGFSAVRPNTRGSQLQLLLAIFFACELLLASAPSLTLRGFVSSDGNSPIGHYNDGTQQALALIKLRERGGDLYRIQKEYYSVFLDDAMAQSYAGTQSYYFHGSAITRFVDRMNIARVVPHSNYISAPRDRPALLDALSVKYFLARDASLDADRHMKYVGSAADIRVYQRLAARPFGYFVDGLISEASANRLSLHDRDEALLQEAIVTDPKTVEDELTRLNRRGTSKDTVLSSQLRWLQDDHFEGSVQTPTAKILILAMPFDRGWRVKLDGEAVRMHEVDYGLSAVLIPPGSHKLTLRYTPVGRVLGWWVSFAILLTLGLTTLVSHRRRSASRDRNRERSEID